MTEIEWYAQEIRGLVKNHAVFGKFIIEKRELRREYGNLTKALEVLHSALDKIARDSDLRFEIRTREGSVFSRIYYVKWFPREAKNPDDR